MIKKKRVEFNKKGSQYTIVDLFAGVGGLSLGFVEKGFDLVLANDNDKEASETFRYNHPNTAFIEGEIQNITEEVVRKYIKSPTIDVLVGGVPCQSFSMVGYRTTSKEKNLGDPRHFLFKEFIFFNK